MNKEDVVYWENDFSEEIFFIKHGLVKIYAKNNFPFASYGEGEHFGDTDVLNKSTRDGKAVAQSDCTFFSLHKDMLYNLFDQFPDMKREIEETTEKKR